MSDEIWQRGQTDAASISAAVLYSRIADVVAWCRNLMARSDVNASLRTDAIKPRLLHNGCDDAVCDVGSSRHWQIRVTTDQPRLDFPDLEGGRLLTYFPDADLCDGAAELETDNFFDVFNCPPWDTWVGFFNDNLGDASYGRYLLAYVPEQLVPLVESGILVNPEECIMWLTNSDVKLKGRLSTHLKT